MKSLFRISVSIVAVFFAYTLTVPSSSASHSWGTYHWARAANPFTLAVGDNVSSAWDSYLTTTINDWSASTVLNLVRVEGATRPRTCKATTGRIEVCNDTYGSNGWLGIARISISGSHITAATTRVNDTYFNTPTYNTPAWRNLVMCQEVGHDFGLAHQDENFNNANLGSCMDYTSDPDGGGAFGPGNEHPNSHDYAQLESIYAHTDSTTTVGSFGLVAPQDEGEPDAWGKLVSSSRNGRVHVYELDLGKGRRIITHVFWADPDRDRHHHHE